MEPQLSEVRSPFADARGSSLPEVHSSVHTGAPSLFKRMFAFAGPAYLVAVGYMDPGNWATDLEGGARFGYDLLWVLVMSNFMAILLQTLSARLGIVTQRDLAQACRESYPRPVSIALWVLCEVAIAACDLAEVLGAAIGLNLLFGLPLIAGVIVTATDTLLVLWFTRMGIRVIEGFVLTLVAVITGCFLLELAFAKPAVFEMIHGLVPRLTDQSLYVAIGILGATVMPHNLYLHSALVQTRRIGVTLAEKRSACRFNLIDSLIALNGALVVNAAILILAGTVFFKRGIVVTEIQQAHELLAPMLGTTVASVLFAVALLCSGQSSTLTGTLAGQIVMEGFVNLRVRPWLRRFITRMLAVIPAVLTIWLAGEKGTYQLLILSQVILSMQLPFAVIPLVQFTSDRARMGEFRTTMFWRTVAWVVAAVIVVLNIRLFGVELAEWTKAAGAYSMWLWVVAGPVLLALAGLLSWIVFQPVLPMKLRNFGRAPVRLPEAAPEPEWTEPVYRSILVPLDHSNRDADAITHAASLAKAHGSKLHLLHVEEDVTSQVYGDISSTAEVESGQRYFERILAGLGHQGIEAELHLAHGVRPRAAIIEAAERLRPDLIVMGAHGHRGLQDLALGRTIDSVRHHVDVPLLVVRTEKKH
jgi:manganese transport protein